jgi:serine/threonine protein kinase
MAVMMLIGAAARQLLCSGAASVIAVYDGRRYALFPFINGRDRQDHPWVGDRRGELLASVDRLEAVIEKARAIEVPLVVCHHDLFPHNILVGLDGRIAALLDWGHTKLAPREHDLYAALCEEETVRFLRAYGAEGLNITHLEYARLARSVRDIGARVVNEVDQDGLNTWAFAGLRRVDADLALARPFCDS